MRPTENRDATQVSAATDRPATGAAPRPPAMWAIVELFGHARIAGTISEQAFGGAALVRVDVPEVRYTEETYIDGEPASTERCIAAHTRSFGAASIYSINWCDEATALLAAHSMRHEPLRPYSLRNVLASMPDSERQRLLALTAGSTTAIAGDDYDRFN